MPRPSLEYPSAESPRVGKRRISLGAVAEYVGIKVFYISRLM